MAHRAILMGRVRSKLDAGDREAARKLMDQLNELPLQSTFDRRIETAERANRSDDPKVQGRIDQLFADTRQMLSRFLNVRQLNELQSQVNQVIQ